MTNASLIREVLRVVHDREKLHAYEASTGRSHADMEAGRAWSYKEIMEIVQIYDARKRRRPSRKVPAAPPVEPARPRKRVAKKAG